MAPEVISEANYNTKADIYSFALCLYEMTVGYNPLRDLNGNVTCVMASPYLGITLVATMVKKVVYEGYRPEFRREGVPHPDIRRLIEGCWHSDVEKRPTAALAYQALTRVQLPGLEYRILSLLSPHQYRDQKAFTDASESISWGL